MNTKRIISKTAPPYGQAPAVILDNPKYAHNVAAIVRAASCFGITQVWFSGDRVMQDVDGKKRLPREERMKGYKEVELINFDYPFDQFTDAYVVGVELVKGAMDITFFEHPKNTVYVFGPEDGSISKVFRSHCYEFVKIPSRHCLNLAAAVYITLFDRVVVRYEQEGEELPVLAEDRGFIPVDL